MQATARQHLMLRMLFVPCIGLMMLLGVITGADASDSRTPAAPMATEQTVQAAPMLPTAAPPTVTQVQLVYARACTVTIRDNDTLSRIASRHGTTARALFDSNRDSVSHIDRIRAGRTLRLPGCNGSNSTASNNTSDESVAVQAASTSSHSPDREGFRAYALQQLGGNRTQFNCLDALWGDRESGWRPNAQNPDSTAYGIAQFLNSTWASTGIAKTSDGYRQIDAGLIYIDSRYGSPCGAWSHSKSTGWY